MEKEIRKREENRILFEPPEPLFPDGLPRRKIRIRRVVALAVFVCLAVFIWTFAVSGKGSGDGGSESERVNDDAAASDEDITGAPVMSESESGIGDSPVGTESDVGDGETLNEESGTKREETFESEDSTALPPDPSDAAEADLSQIGKGESYVVNYSDKSVDVEGLLDRGFSGGEPVGSAAPLVLVIHTHTSEAYMKSESGFKGLETVVSAGEAISNTANRLGVSAVHCTVIHDADDVNAYLNARDTIDTMLKIYPSIKYVIDVHRLSLYDGELPVRTVSGEKDDSAQIRLTVGAKEEYGDWQEDLSLCLALRKSLNQNGGRICMPVVISPGLPNGDLSRYYVMADIGACGNTVEEAIAAGKRLGMALADVLLGG